MKPVIFPAVVALTLAACAEGPAGFGPSPPPGYEPAPTGPITFDSRDFAWSTAAGTSSINGSLAFHEGGRRYSCQGGDVLLTPETAWSRRRMVILYGSAVAAAAPASIVRARTPPSSPPDYPKFVRKTTEFVRR